MKRWLTLALFALSVALLAGCATPTVTSQVTTFHRWPEQLQDKTYVFERSAAENNNLEYLNYENLVRGQLARLGFREAAPAQSPVLRVTLKYHVDVRDVHEVYPVVIDPYGPFPVWGGRYGPYYDPFWYGPPVVEQRQADYTLYTRTLDIAITRIADGKALYETKVVSKGTNSSLAAVMPYMIRSAFVDFPGKSGVPHYVELPMK